ncbi:MAG: Hint domain-containing protein [Nonlabens sp.]
MLEEVIDDLIKSLKADLIVNGNINLSVFDPITAAIISALKGIMSRAMNRLLAKGFRFSQVDEGFQILLEGIDIDRYSSKKEYSQALKNLLDKPQNRIDDYIDAVKKYGDDADNRLSSAFEKMRKTNSAKYWDDFHFSDFFPPPNPPKKPCFLAGTPVHTTTGIKPIQEIIIGDIVLCYDTQLGTLSRKQVIQTYRNHAHKYRIITTENGDELKATGQHLFYVKSSDTWIKVHQLKVGMHLYDPQKDDLVKITELKVIEEEVTTYNLEVEDLHNYLVGATGLLSHNSNKRPGYKSTSKRGYSFYGLGKFGDIDIQYVGKTTRNDLALRLYEHQLEGDRALNGKKTYYSWKANVDAIPNLNKGANAFVEMTEFESAVWERAYIEQQKVKGIKLRNRSMPLGRRMGSFKKYQRYFKNNKNINPCIYF